MPTRRRICPDCLTRSLITRTGKYIDNNGILRDEYLECVNLLCAGTYVGSREVTHRLSPPRIENPAAALPYADPKKLAVAKADLRPSTEKQNAFDFEV